MLARVRFKPNLRTASGSLPILFQGDSFLPFRGGCRERLVARPRRESRPPGSGSPCGIPSRTWFSWLSPADPALQAKKTRGSVDCLQPRPAKRRPARVPTASIPRPNGPLRDLRAGRPASSKAPTTLHDSSAEAELLRAQRQRGWGFDARGPLPRAPRRGGAVGRRVTGAFFPVAGARGSHVGITRAHRRLASAVMARSFVGVS